VKGGFEVQIGRHRAFCPLSQIDAARADATTHEGRVYRFRVIEYKDGGRNLVVSRRALIEEEQRANAAEIRRTIVPGAVMAGRIASVRDFGAFVDLGSGVQGLLHVSEMDWVRVSDASQVVKPGQDVTVKVLRVDDNGQKISLGLKQLTDDPWTKVPQTYAVGQVRAGRVTRLAEFGAFVELEPGIEALAHASTFAPTGKSERWSAQVPAGTTAAFEIVTIDVEKKRIGVALVPEGSSRASRVMDAAGSDAPGGNPAGGEPAASERLGSLADKLRSALEPRNK
jgi:small subunit ribosomal protein S1